MQSFYNINLFADAMKTGQTQFNTNSGPVSSRKNEIKKSPELTVNTLNFNNFSSLANHNSRVMNKDLIHVAS